MKISRWYFPFVLWLALATGLTLPLRAQAPEAPPAPPATAPVTDPADEAKPASPATPAAENAKPSDDEKTRATEKPAADSEDAPEEAPEAKEESEPKLRDLTKSDDESKPARSKVRVRRGRHESDVPFGDTQIDEGIRQTEAVSIMGNTVVDGEVSDVAVSILGDTTVNGKVYGEAVSVLGTTRINGYVRGEAVAVLGDVVLGPGAEVGGDVVAVMGRVVRGENSKIRGNVTQVSGFGDFGDFEWLRAYIDKCLRWGRPLWFGEHLGWVWAVAAGFLVFYMLLALIFPRGIERCAAVLEERPGSTILATFLTALLTPVLVLLLIMTGIGIILIPFLGAGLIIATLFGKAAVLAWFGRRVTRHLGSGPMTHAVAAVFIGGFIVAALYLIPFLGFLLQKLFSVLGLGMVVYVLILSTRREKAAAAATATPGVVPVVPVAPLASAATGVAGTVEGVPPAPITAVGAPPVLISAATLPRAGFWIRTAAGLLDMILLGITVALLDEMLWFRFDGPGVLFLGLAAYSATLWKLRGTTIGGIICGLKVVRTDDRPIDWTIAIVRALSAFLSFALAGLGFIWVAFDEEKQSWHDKIAGTTIVKVPKGISLL